MPICDITVPEFGEPREKDNLYMQLWHACAGPLVNVPTVGDKVFYFPQGHIEQVEAYTNPDGEVEMPVYDLPSKILCKVVYAQLQAEAHTDEVYAQITLLPEQEGTTLESGSSCQSISRKFNAVSFSKRLTPSDTSTHGGFSVPKRHADECFPPLDMSREPPAQELVAKDLHGTEWRFRHIYRGQPKRHLLTSGWSSFVTAKKLVAGDACIFLRGENGELFVGVRRKTKPQANTSASVLSGHSMQHGILASASHAMTTGTMFTVYYHPWTSPAEFIVPHDRYMKSAEIDYSIGTRFRMHFEGEDYPEPKPARIAGTVVGIDTIDPIRWDDSEWRCLEVEWDVRSRTSVRPHRVSPWSIEPTVVKKRKFVSLLLNRKRARPLDSSTPMLPVIAADGLLKSPVDCAQRRQLGVLQGQEIGAMHPCERGAFPQPNPVYMHDPMGQPNGNHKCMLFGVNISTSPVALPSNQILSSQELYNPCPSQVSGPSKGISGKNPYKQCRNCSPSANRSCTKVLKYGTSLGRSVDLARFDGYGELIRELDQMFEFKGTLIDGSCGWYVTYMDAEGDMMLIGDYPWPEFQAMVRKMFVCPKEDVDKLDPSSPNPPSS